MKRREQWPRDLPLVRLSPKDVLTLEDCSAGGILATGSVGSSKTTSTLQVVARAMLAADFGMLFLCGKADASDDYIRWATEEGRASDVIHFRPGEHRFNFLSYESNVHGSGKAVIENILDVLMSAYEMVARKYGSGGRDDFFDEGRKQMLRNLLWIDVTAHGGVDLGRILRMTQSLPQSMADLEQPERLYSLQCLIEAERRVTPERERELELARNYLGSEIPLLSDRTRSSLQITASVFLDAFQRFPLYDLFNGINTVTPDDVLAGKIWILDVSVKEYDLIGKICGAIVKRCVQRAIERRMKNVHGSAEHVRPVVLFADESHFWANGHDTDFMTTARSARGISVYATQNIPNFLMEIGAEGTGKAKVDSLLGNFQCRFYHQNIELQTNIWAADSFGKILVRRDNGGAGINVNSGPQGGTVGRNFNEGWGEVLDYDVMPREFTGLKRGGKQNKFEAESIVTVAGKRFKWNEERWLRVTIEQFKARPSWKRFIDRKPYLYVAVDELNLWEWLKRFCAPQVARAFSAISWRGSVRDFV